MRRPTFMAAALAAALAAAPAAADWLVTLDGGRVETRGAWTVKGKLVVFTRADGQLVSLRASDVDWAASERATGAQAEAAARREEGSPAPQPVKESRWVLSDADFKQAPPPAAEKKEPAPTPEETDDAGRPRVPVVLESWDRKNLQDGLEIAGSLRNPGNELAAEIGVTVRLYDETGALVATGEGRVGTPTIGPGTSTSFRATFPGVFTYAEARFDVRGFGLRIKAAAPPGAPSSPGTAGSPPDRIP
jgi:hypothetical protein